MQKLLTTYPHMIKIIIFIFSIIFTPTLFSQNPASFQPYWEFGMQYNYEANSAFKRDNSSLSSATNLPVQPTTHKASFGYSCTINSQFNISRNFAIFTNIGVAFRNYTSNIPVFIFNGITANDITNANQAVSYTAFEFLTGLSIRPKAEKKQAFSVGLGLAYTDNFKITNDAIAPFQSFQIRSNTYISGTPVFSFFAFNYTLKKTASARLFIEPHFKMDLFKRKDTNSHQQHFTFGIGIGFSVKITN